MTTFPDQARRTRVLDLRVGDKIAYLTPDAIKFSAVASIVDGLGAMSTDATSFLAYSEVYLMSRAAPPDEPLTVIRDVTVRVDSRGKTPARPYTATYPLMVRSRSGWTGYLNERDSHDMDYFPADHVHEFIDWSPVT